MTEDNEESEVPKSEHPSYQHSDGWQLVIWKVVDDPGSSKLAKVWSLFMMLVILYSILNFTLASIPGGLVLIDVWTNISSGQVVLFSTEGDFSGNGDGMTRTDGVRQASDEHDDYREPYRALEVFCIATFTLEFLLRLITCRAGPGLPKFLKGPSNIVDLISIVPFYLELILVNVGNSDGAGLGFLQVLRLIRLTRIVRIFKMSKTFESLIVLFTTVVKSVNALLMLFFFMAVFSVLFATLIFTVEPGNFDPYRNQFVRVDGSASPFESIPASTWWTIITMTTVGYGDHYPVTGLGQLVAVITMLTAIVVIALPITIVGANFDEEYSKALERKDRADKEKLEAKAKERNARREAREGQGKGALKALGDATKLAGALGECTAQKAVAACNAVAHIGSPRASSPFSVASHRHRHRRRGAGPGVLTGVEGLINHAHVEFIREVEQLMQEQERGLKRDIERVLSQCDGNIKSEVM